MSFFIHDAMAQSGAPAGQAPAGGGLSFLIMIVIFFALMYFMLIRPQQKRAKEHRQMVEGLSKGDEIATNGGLVGKITNVGDNFLTLEIGTGVEIKVQRQAVAQVLPKGTLKSQ
ncbi:MAG: preprotein translocase subunit YajC [Gammaproteobacteria bacterium]|jgi:preprotein translocase subunit YajC